jgi:hypothetical protein
MAYHSKEINLFYNKMVASVCMKGEVFNASDVVMFTNLFEQLL